MSNFDRCNYGSFDFPGSDSTKETVIDIESELDGKYYKYSVSFESGELIMESLLVDGSFVYSRFIDSPDFALSMSFFTEQDLKIYSIFRDQFTRSLLEYCIPGRELLKEMTKIIFVDDWLSKRDSNFLNDFEDWFPELNYNELVNRVITEYGFDDDYEGTVEGTRCLVCKRIKDTVIPFEMAGSGFTMLATVYPLMVASKKYGYSIVSELPLDASIHCILSKKLMSWFLEDLPNVNVIGRLQHTEF